MSKRVVLPLNLFLQTSVHDKNAKLRFRLISEDRNSISQWTSIFSINPELIFIRGTNSIPGKIHLQKIGDTVRASWDSVSVNKYINDSFVYLQDLSEYDIWIRWAGASGANPSNWIYKERISSTSLDVVIPTTYPNPNSPFNNITPKYLYIEVYRVGKPVSRFEDVDDFVQNSISVDLTNDTIFFEDGQEYVTGSPIVYTSATPITGLTNGATYCVRVINASRISLYPTENDAINNTNKINLSGTPSGTGTITGYPLRMYSALITTL